MTPDCRVLVDAAAPMWWRQGVRGGFQRNADFDILVIRRAVTSGDHVGDAMTAYWQSCNVNGYFAGYRTIIVNSVVTDAYWSVKFVICLSMNSDTTLDWVTRIISAECL